MTLLTTTWLDEAEQRAELAAEVTLPIDQFKALLAAAREAVDLRAGFDASVKLMEAQTEVLDAAESARDSLRERLEIAVEHLKLISLCAGSYKKNCSHVDHEEARAALAKISAIAAKACTGGKGEEGK